MKSEKNAAQTLAGARGVQGANDKTELSVVCYSDCTTKAEDSQERRQRIALRLIEILCRDDGGIT